MCSASYVNPPVHAYLIPSGDAHQVCVFSFCKIVYYIIVYRFVFVVHIVMVDHHFHFIVDYFLFLLQERV